MVKQRSTDTQRRRGRRASPPAPDGRIRSAGAGDAAFAPRFAPPVRLDSAFFAIGLSWRRRRFWESLSSGVCATAEKLGYHASMALFSRKPPAAPLHAPVTVRPATADDADAVVRLARGLSMTDGGRPSRLTAEAYRRDGFGDNPAFHALVAVIDDAIVGYALFFPGYDTDRAARGVYLADLYVDRPWRRQGVGRALMKGVARACRDAGGTWMFWSVLRRNRDARRFYRTLAPELRDVVLCAALGESFDRLTGGDGISR
jgi:GNAT superfamily N-acetyltransferase